MSVAEGDRRVISIFWKAIDRRLSALLELENTDTAATDHRLIMDDVPPDDLGRDGEIEVTDLRKTLSETVVDTVSRLNRRRFFLIVDQLLDRAIGGLSFQLARSVALNSLYSVSVPIADSANVATRAYPVKQLWQIRKAKAFAKASGCASQR